jgi:hypothetical protein
VANTSWVFFGLGAAEAFPDRFLTFSQESLYIPKNNKSFRELADFLAETHSCLCNTGKDVGLNSYYE